MNTPASTYTATRSGLTASAPWKPDALVKAGLVLLLAGALLQALQASR
jgi:hypothetical protein